MLEGRAGPPYLFPQQANPRRLSPTDIKKAPPIRGSLDHSALRITSSALVVPLVAKHVVELRDLVAAALRYRRLFKIAVAADVFDNAFAIELLFQAAQRSLDGLTLADFYFNCHNFRERRVPRRQSSASSILFGGIRMKSARPSLSELQFDYLTPKNGRADSPLSAATMSLCKFG